MSTSRPTPSPSEEPAGALPPASATPPPPAELPIASLSSAAEPQVRYLRIIALAIVTATVILGAVILHQLASVARPFFIALLLCYLIWPATRLLHERGLPKWVAYLLTSTSLFLVVFAVGQLVVINVEEFASNLDVYHENLSTIVDRFNALAIQLHLLSPETPLSLDTLDHWIPQNAVASVLGGSTSRFFSFVGDVFVVLFFVVFIFIEAEHLPDRIRRAYGPPKAEGILATLREINQGIHSYIGLKFVVSFATGVLATIVMALFGLDFYYLFGTLTFLLNFIPYLGSIAATLLPGSIALVQFGSPLDALWLMLSLTAIQMGIGNLLEPQIQARNLNLSPLLILLALAIWGFLWGVVGMILAVPITMAIRIVLDHVPEMQKYAILMSHQKSDSKQKPSVKTPKVVS